MLPPIHDTLNAQVVEKWAPKIGTAAIHFLVDHQPDNFLFDRLALSNDLQDRIPHELRTGYSITTTNPSLASLKFGRHPQPSETCKRASGILLALPFERLREWFEVMRQKKGGVKADLFKAILQERDYRRLYALCEHAKLSYTATPGSGGVGGGKKKKGFPDWYKRELGYQEFVVRVQTNADEVEFSLHREWKGSATGGGLIRRV